MSLFRPEYTDEQTGYRYYTAEQIPLLNTILVLKAIGVKLIDIRSLVDNGLNPEQLTAVMASMKNYWENQIEIAKFNIENIKKIKFAAETKIQQNRKAGRRVPDAYKMARLVCLQNIKVELLEALWL
jgi:DNA-binding transcriptional MerR regulator